MTKRSYIGFSLPLEKQARIAQAVQKVGSYKELIRLSNEYTKIRRKNKIPKLTKDSDGKYHYKETENV